MTPTQIPSLGELDEPSSKQTIPSLDELDKQDDFESVIGDQKSVEPSKPEPLTKEQEYAKTLPPITLGDESKGAGLPSDIAKSNLEAANVERQVKQAVATKEADAVESIDADLRAYHKDGNFAYMNEEEKDALKDVLRRQNKKLDVNFDKAFDTAFQMAQDRYAKNRNKSIYDTNLEKAQEQSPNKSVPTLMKEFDEQNIERIANTSLTPKQKEVYRLIKQRDDLRQFLGKDYTQSTSYNELTDKINEMRDAPDLYSTVTGELRNKDPKLASVEEAIHKKAETYATTYKDNVGNALVKTDLALKQLDEQLAASSRVKTDVTGNTYSYKQLSDSDGPLDKFFATGDNAKEVATAKKLQKERDDIYMEREALKQAYLLNKSSGFRTSEGFWGGLASSLATDIPGGKEWLANNSSSTFAKGLVQASKTSGLETNKMMDEATKSYLMESIGQGTGEGLKLLPKLVLAGAAMQVGGEIAGVHAAKEALLESPSIVNKLFGHLIGATEEAVKFKVAANDAGGGAGFYAGQQAFSKFDMPYAPTGFWGQALKTVVNYTVHNGIGGGVAGMGGSGVANSLVQSLTKNETFQQALDEHFGTGNDAIKNHITNFFVGMALGLTSPKQLLKEFNETKTKSAGEGKAPIEETITGLEKLHKELIDAGYPADAEPVQAVIDQADEAKKKSNGKTEQPAEPSVEEGGKRKEETTPAKGEEIMPEKPITVGGTDAGTEQGESDKTSVEKPAEKPTIKVKKENAPIVGADNVEEESVVPEGTFKGYENVDFSVVKSKKEGLPEYYIIEKGTGSVLTHGDYSPEAAIRTAKEQLAKVDPQKMKEKLYQMEQLNDSKFMQSLPFRYSPEQGKELQAEADAYRKEGFNEEADFKESLLTQKLRPGSKFETPEEFGQQRKAAGEYLQNKISAREEKAKMLRGEVVKTTEHTPLTEAQVDESLGMGYKKPDYVSSIPTDIKNKYAEFRDKVGQIKAKYGYIPGVDIHASGDTYLKSDPLALIQRWARNKYNVEQGFSFGNKERIEKDEAMMNEEFAKADKEVGDIWDKYMKPEESNISSPNTETNEAEKTEGGQEAEVLKPEAETEGEQPSGLRLLTKEEIKALPSWERGKMIAGEDKPISNFGVGDTVVMSYNGEASTIIGIKDITKGSGKGGKEFTLRRIDDGSEWTEFYRAGSSRDIFQKIDYNAPSREILVDKGIAPPSDDKTAEDLAAQVTQAERIKEENQSLTKHPKFTSGLDFIGSEVSDLQGEYDDISNVVYDLNQEYKKQLAAFKKSKNKAGIKEMESKIEQLDNEAHSYATLQYEETAPAIIKYAAEKGLTGLNEFESEEFVGDVMTEMFDRPGIEYNFNRKVHEIIDDAVERWKEEHAPEEEVVATTPVEEAKGFISVPLKDLTTDLESMQGRKEEYSKQTFDRIVNEAKSGELNVSAIPPIQIWKNAEGKWVILGGHSRTAGFKSLAAGEHELNAKFKPSDFENINAQVVEAGSLEEAKKIAQESNQTAAQTSSENASYVRKELLPKLRGKELDEKLSSLYGKDAKRIKAYANLNPNGKAMDALKLFEVADASKSEDAIKNVAQWVGETRQALKQLTDAQENEIYDFLIDKEASKRFTRKEDFIQKVASIVGTLNFTPESILNLKRVQAITQGESVYDTMRKDLEEQIKAKQAQIDELNDRFNNPNNKQYVKPTSPDYDNLVKLADNLKEKHAADLKLLRKKMLDLVADKGNMVGKGLEQGGLFDAPLEITPQQEAKVKEEFGVTVDDIEQFKNEEDGNKNDSGATPRSEVDGKTENDLGRDGSDGIENTPEKGDGSEAENNRDASEQDAKNTEESKPTVRKLREGLGKKIIKLDEDLLKDLDDFANNVPPAGLMLNPEQMALGIRILGKFTQKGVYKFADVVLQLVEAMGEEKAKGLIPALKAAYASFHMGADDAVSEELSDLKEVKKFDFDNFIKETYDEEPVAEPPKLDREYPTPEIKDVIEGWRNTPDDRFLTESLMLKLSGDANATKRVLMINELGGGLKRREEATVIALKNAFKDYISKNKIEPYVSDAARRVEPISEVGKAQDKLGKENVEPIAGELGVGDGERGKPTDESGVLGPDNKQLPTDSPTLFGEGGDKKIQDQKPEVDRPVAGGDERGGSRGNGSEGQESELDRAKRLNEIAERERAVKKKLQQEAEYIPVRLLDKDNIADTLPFLFPEQHGDVYKAETRFYSPEHDTEENQYGKGIMFTNGTGTGKTFTALGIAKRMIKQGKKDILVVTPNQKMITDWVRAAGEMGIEGYKLEDTKDGGQGFSVTTHKNFLDNDAIEKKDWDLVIYDESHALMRNQEGNMTSITRKHRAVSKSPSEAMSKAKENIKYDERLQELKKGSPMSNFRPDSDGIQKLDDKLKEEYLNVLRKTKVVFLSATPFSHPFNLDYADGYLTTISQGKDYAGSTGYNSGNAQDLFFMQNFGYRMRYNKLTQPEAGVDTGLLERDFIDRMIQRGVISDRALSVDHDYSRDFALVDDETGQMIDNGIETISKETRDKKYKYLDELMRKKLDWHYLNQMTEAIKAKHAIGRIKEHLALGRKVHVFHTYNHAIPDHPFDLNDSDLIQLVANQAKADMGDIREEVRQFEREHPEFKAMTLGDLANPIETLRREFGKPAEKVGDIVTVYKAGEKGVLHSKAKVVGLKDGKANIEYQHRFEEEYVDENGEKKSRHKTETRTAVVDIDQTRQDSKQFMTFNGEVSKPNRESNVKRFNDDFEGPNILLTQIQAGKEGISLHDQTGVHQRVQIRLDLPIEPVNAIQGEGRIYRIGQKSDAPFEYMALHTNFEKNIFGQKISQRVGTAENLSSGSKARNLKESFLNGYLNASGMRPNSEQGTGGKRMDSTFNKLTPFEKAKTYYFQRRKGRQLDKGTDYFPTPEPLGYKMMEWLGLKANESVLEPSAGHGAIARFAPENVSLTAVEPEYHLNSELSLHLPEGSRKEMTNFEDFHITNKYDGIAMNPPYGHAGTTAISHLAKAAKHLKDGGRVIALVPEGAFNDKFSKWFYGNKDTENLALRAIVKLPSSTFERAGTKVATQLLVIDRIDNEQQRNDVGPYENIDLTRHEDINDLFDSLEDMPMPERVEVAKPEVKEGEKKGVGANGLVLVENKHTKTGADLFTVKMEKRLSGDVYQQLNAEAKKLGGYYSSFKGNGAIPGFIFKNKASAEKFIAEQGDNGGGDDVGFDSRAPKKKVSPLGVFDDALKNTETQLKESADNVEEKINDLLGGASNKVVNPTVKADFSVEDLKNAVHLKDISTQLIKDIADWHKDKGVKAGEKGVDFKEGKNVRTGLVQWIRSRDTMGVFFSKTGIVNVNNLHDVNTLAHELGHWMDMEVFKISGRTGSLAGQKVLIGELKDFLKKENHYKVSTVEGIAEFLRVYITDPATAVKEMPNFHFFFENLIATEPKLQKAIETARQGYVHGYSAQDPRMLVQVAMENKNPDKPSFMSGISTKLLPDNEGKIVKSGLSGAGDRLKFELLDSTAYSQALEAAMKEVDPKLPAGKNPMAKIVKLLGSAGQIDVFGSEYQKAFDAFKGGEKLLAEGHLFAKSGLELYERADEAKDAIADITANGFETSIPWNTGHPLKIKPTSSGFEFTENGNPAIVTSKDQKQAIKELKAEMERLKKHIELVDETRGVVGMPRKTLEATVALNDADPTLGKTKLDKLSEDVRETSTKVLQYAVDNGLISQEDFDTITEMRQNYVSFKRVFEEHEKSFVGTGGMSNSLGSSTRKVVKGLTPSIDAARPIRRPMEGFLKNASDVVTMANKNSALAAHIEGLKMVDPSSVQEIPVAKLLYDKEGNLTWKSFQDAKGDPAKYQIVQVKEFGKLKYYRVPKDIFETVFNYELAMPNDPLHRALSFPARVLKATAVYYNPEYAPRNVFRDTMTATMNSKYGFGQIGGVPAPYVSMLYTFPKGIFNALAYENPNSKLLNLFGDAGVYKKFLESGADQAFLVNVNHSEKIYRDFYGVEGWDKVKAGWDNTKYWLKLINNYSEIGTRVSVFENAYKKTGSTELAAQEARESTADYARHGASLFMRKYTPLIPFLNPGLQHMALLARSAKEQPGKFMYAGAIGITIPTLALWGINNMDEKRRKAYQALPPWRKQMFWNLFVLGADHPPLSIPKGSAGILFGSSVETMLDNHFNNDAKVASVAHAEDMQAIKDVSSAFLQAYSPVQNWVDLVPQIIKPGVELWANKNSFTGRDIIPARMKGDAPEQQFDDRTPEVIKAIGANLGMSPMKIDHVVKSYTGGIGYGSLVTADYAMQKMGMVDKKSEDVFTTLSRLPITKAFVSQTNTGSRSGYVDKFYQGLSEMEQVAKTVNDKVNSGQNVQEWLDQDEHRKYQYQYYLKNKAQINAFKGVLTAYRGLKPLWMEENPEAAKQRIVQVDNDIATVAKQLSDSYRNDSPMPDVHSLFIDILDADKSRKFDEKVQREQYKISNGAGIENLPVMDKSVGELTKLRDAKLKVINETAAYGGDTRNLAIDVSHINEEIRKAKNISGEKSNWIYENKLQGLGSVEAKSEIERMSNLPKGDKEHISTVVKKQLLNKLK